MTEKKTANRRRHGHVPLKAEDLLPALMRLARLVALLAPNLPSEERAAAEAFLADCAKFEENAHV